MAQPNVGYKCTKNSFAIFNMLAYICGLATLVLGLVARHKNIIPEVLYYLEGMSIMFIVLGTIILMLGFLGFCGAFCQNSALLILFATLMSIMFVLFFNAGICSLLVTFCRGRDGIEESLEETLKENIKSLDELNSALECCGAVGPSDYGTKIPDSCCKNSKPCGSQSPDLRTDGCTTILEELESKFGLAICVTSLVDLVVIFISIVLSSVLAAKIRKQLHSTIIN
ncbi:cd63 antigen [Cichlidogyrus casuarinus]|uniref:Tetraspanin n=1 Tax=Cichlidogyrus casuarinus TaxID=1844966 RepID=A0ABD2PU87_9PLAT